MQIIVKVENGFRNFDEISLNPLFLPKSALLPNTLSTLSYVHSSTTQNLALAKQATCPTSDCPWSWVAHLGGWNWRTRSQAGRSKISSTWSGFLPWSHGCLSNIMYGDFMSSHFFGSYCWHTQYYAKHNEYQNYLGDRSSFKSNTVPIQQVQVTFIDLNVHSWLVVLICGEGLRLLGGNHLRVGVSRVNKGKMLIFGLMCWQWCAYHEITTLQIFQ